MLVGNILVGWKYRHMKMTFLFFFFCTVESKVLVNMISNYQTLQKISLQAPEIQSNFDTEL